MFPLFEAVVNSIHSIDELTAERDFGKITVEILRAPFQTLPFDGGKMKRGVPPSEEIVGFKIIDNGVGFHDRNMKSFATLDTDYKESQGCRGVGRLLWLKAFQSVTITSVYRDDAGSPMRRSFSFTATRGIEDEKKEACGPDDLPTTCVHLDGFHKIYREKSAKTPRTIASSILEHCLWYFVREGGAPTIRIKDDEDDLSLDQVYEEYMFSEAKRESIEVKGSKFELTHIKLKASSSKPHFIAWCAGSRVVEEENLVGKIAGLHGKIREDDGDFVYACYVTSPFLDQRVRSQRIGFDIEEESDDLFSETELTLNEIRNAVISSSGQYLDAYLQESKKAGQERVDKFVSHKAPRYRPIMARISSDKLSVDPDISDKDLDLLLHKHLSEIEGTLLSEGHEVMNFGENESPTDYQARLTNYLKMADDIKKSDLANYVFHRKVILDILEKAIQRQEGGRYSKEELIHEIIMPLKKTSSEVRLDSCNLWLIDERLAFHNFLASDKTLSSMPITGCTETKEPDICALNVYDEPILIAEGQRLPLASIVIIELKRPMRNDAASGEEKNPIEQALGYLERIRTGGAKTDAGRQIPDSNEIPGFCYIICDITPTVDRQCKTLSLTITSDKSGYFGYNPNYKAYIEVMSFDRLLNAARERNRAFFDKLGLPTT
jgi:hypothetical protein